MAYAKRYVGGFIDKPTQTTPVDSTFLNAVEAALLKLYALDPNDAQVMAWVAANARFEPKLLTNANIDPAAAIAKSKLAALAIVDADIAGGAGIAQSKLALAITNAQIDAAAAIALSKLAGYPADATKYARGDGTWAAIPRVIRGGVSGAGAITKGTGFTVARGSVGVYTITFTAAFSATPIVVVTPSANTGGVLPIWFTNGITTGTCVVQFFTTGAAAVDLPFDFIAYEA